MLVGSMLLSWPWIGRRGHLHGLTMLARVGHVSEALGVPHHRLLTIAWFAMPVCGALVMLCTGHHRAWSRRVAVVVAVIALVETVLMARAYSDVGLDPWAGKGLVVALAGAVVATVGSAVSWLSCRQQS